MTFDMGSFSAGELRRHGTGVALDPQGKPLAFVTWRPFAQGRGAVLDLMRSQPDIRNILDFIMVESILHFFSRGVEEISLGNAPLANASEEYAPTSVEDRVVRYIYENLNQVYAYKPLFEFKRKYRPHWKRRFLAYPTGESLPLISLALVRVHTSRHPWSFLWRRN
jgi:phosphatidylglycerol lysyltransferase